MSELNPRTKVRRLINNDTDIDNMRYVKYFSENKWVKEYAALPAIDRRNIIKDMSQFIGDAVLDTMNTKEDTIHIPSLGMFERKPYKDLYMRLKVENPNLNRQELYALLKEVINKQEELTDEAPF